MAGRHDPPGSYGFNKLRGSGGSHRLTLVKAAVEDAGIDPQPPRPVLALLPVGDGAWVGFDVERHDDQGTRVAVRRVLTAELSAGGRVVGEYPVPVRGKLGSSVLTVPKELVDALDLRGGEPVTTVAVAPGCLLFATERAVADGDVAAAVEAARERLPDR